MTDAYRPEYPRDIQQTATERTVTEFERTFHGIQVDGIDLASANRVAFYISVKDGQAFASPSRWRRTISTLRARAVVLRARLRGTSPTPSPPSPGAPKCLFFFEGVNPAVEDTLQSVLLHFTRDEARAARAHAAEIQGESEHEWQSLSPLFPTGVANAFQGLERAIRARQRAAEIPLLRRSSLRAWLSLMAIRTAWASRAFRLFYDAFPTTVLVTASDTGFWGRCATLEAIRRGIPSITLQHGMMAGEAGYVPVISDRFCAWGEASARWLRARRVPSEKIVVTGATRLDAIFNRPRRPREVIAADLGVETGRRWVVLATNPIPFERNAALLETARKGVINWGEPAILLVKLHPSEDPVPYRSVIEGDPDVVVIPHGKVDLYDLLAASDAVLTFHSSVGLEAMAFDRPVVSLEAFGEENPLPYARTGAAAVARTAEELARTLREEVAPGTRASERRSARARYVRDNLLAIDGKSGGRVRDLVVSLIRERPV